MEKEIKIRRVAIIGPESTGKTTLAQRLAEHFNTTWVAEHSRIYVEHRHGKYDRLDIEKIAKEQWQQELIKIHNANCFIFIDTEFIVAKVWSEDIFKECSDWIINMHQTHPYDFYLLTYPDLPWIFDPVRENPHRRDYFFDLYKKELEASGLPYSIIKGDGDERFLNALSSLNKFFKEE